MYSGAVPSTHSTPPVERAEQCESDAVGPREADQALTTTPGSACTSGPNPISASEQGAESIPTPAPAPAPAPAPEDCCTLRSTPLTTEDAEVLAAHFKALANPTRLRLLSHIAGHGCTNVFAHELVDELGISQPTISHHAAKLVAARLLTRTQEGRLARYTLQRDAFDSMARFVDLS